MVFQSMQTAFQRGRIYTNIATRTIELGPNLAIIPNANRAYEDMIAMDEKLADHFANGHKNFLRDAVYFLYAANRNAEAARWWAYCQTKYGDKLGDQKGMGLDEYAVARVSEDINETSADRIKAVLTGMLAQAYMNLAGDEEDRGEVLLRLVSRVYDNFEARTRNKSARVRMGLAPLDDFKLEVLRDLLAPDRGLAAEFQARLRTRLNLPADFPPPAGTNAPAAPKAG
jgi:hypothetical protein